MTILNNGTRNQYVATSGQTVFNYNFEIIAAADIVVYQGETLLVLTTDYTLTGVGVDTGGTVTLVTGATTGDILTIYRLTAAERLTDYQNSGDFLSDEVNSDFDRLWAVIQENTTSTDLFLQLKQSTTLTLPFELDEPVASNILRYKSDLSGIESVPLSSIPDASTAADLPYDNSTSGLTAVEVQAAIDEVVVDITGKANLTGAAFTGAVSVAGALSSTAGNVNLKSNTALSDAAATLTAAQLIGGEFTITPTVARIQTTDTAANIIAALGGSVDNSNFDMTMINLAAFDVTIAAGTGVTLVGNMVVNDGSATFRVRRLTSSTVSVTRLETGAASTGIELQTAVATTSGTSIDFTGIPADVKRVTILLNEFSISGTSQPIIQIGDSGGIEATGYASTVSRLGASSGTQSTGFILTETTNATILMTGVIDISLISGSLWVQSGNMVLQGSGCAVGAGVKTLTGTLDRVRLTTLGGADTFDAGSMNISWEL